MKNKLAYFVTKSSMFGIGFFLLYNLNNKNACISSDEQIKLIISLNRGISYNKYDYVEGILTLIKRRYPETSSEIKM